MPTEEEWQELAFKSYSETFKSLPFKSYIPLRLSRKLKSNKDFLHLEFDHIFQILHPVSPFQVQIRNY